MSENNPPTLPKETLAHIEEIRKEHLFISQLMKSGLTKEQALYLTYQYLELKTKEKWHRVCWESPINAEELCRESDLFNEDPGTTSFSGKLPPKNKSHLKVIDNE